MTLRDRFNAFLHPSEVKYNPAYQGMVTYGDVPRPVQMPRNYKAYASEGYRNDTVYKCISYIARNGAAIPPILYTDQTRKKRIDKHPLLDLLNKPNNEQSGVAYRESVIGYKLLSGNAFQYALTLKNKGGGAQELWSLRPDYVEPIPSKTRGVIGYKYAFMDEPIQPQYIAHTKYWCPDNDNYGMSPLEVAALMADQQKAAKTWNLALLQNSARPPGAWTVPTPLSKNDRERLQQSLKEKLAGYKNAGTPPVLDAGLTWESMGLPPAQLDWLAGMQYNAVLIANIYNMPPQLVGDTSSSTYANVEEAKSASYTEAVFPELDDFYACQTNWLIPMYPDLANSGACLGYDKETVEVVAKTIQAQKAAQADRANKMYMSGQIMMNESRVMSGLPEVPEGNVYRIGLILVPADKLMDYAEQSLTTPETAPMPQAEGQPAPGGPAQPDTSKNPPTKPQPGKKELDANFVYQPDNLESQLAKLDKRGVKFVEWQISEDPCGTCAMNAGQTVAVGQPFDSGHILPPCHPHCNCSVKESNNNDPKKADIQQVRQADILQRPSSVRISEQGNAREDYQSFRSALNA